MGFFIFLILLIIELFQHNMSNDVFTIFVALMLIDLTLELKLKRK